MGEVIPGIGGSEVSGIFNNPCRGEWNLAKNPEGYMHSSAKYYATGEQGIYEVMSYALLADIDLAKALRKI
jgi:hypothetical protein